MENKLNWIHILEKQPCHGQQIVQLNPVCSDGHHTIGQREYYQTCPFEDLLQYYIKSDLILDFWWIAVEDFPWPDQDIKT